MIKTSEIAPDDFRFSVYVPKFNLQFNHFLIKDSEPNKDILGAYKNAILEYEKGPLMGYTPYTNNTSKLLNSPAELNPKTFATTHGSSFNGDCNKALTDLNLIMKEIWGN
jgi:hypothetical protein